MDHWTLSIEPSRWRRSLAESGGRVSPTEETAWSSGGLARHDEGVDGTRHTTSLRFVFVQRNLNCATADSVASE